MPEKTDYQKVLTEFIQKLMVVLGPAIVLDVARKVGGLSVADDGQVSGISGDSRLVLKSLVKEYSVFSEFITETVLQSVLSKYPSVVIK